MRRLSDHPRAPIDGCPRPPGEFHFAGSLEALTILLDSMPEPSFIVDGEGIIRVFNAAYENFLGVSRSDVIGRPVREIMANTRIPNVLATGEPELEELMEIRGLDAIVQRLPVKVGGATVGAIARVTFRNVFELRSLIHKVEQLQHQIDQCKEELGAVLSPKYGFKDIVGRSSAIEKAKQLAQKIALGDSSVLIIGESGVGKELFAHAIHAASLRRNRPFVCLNCAAMPKDLVESELFGYQKGAFTGADRSGKPGKFEIAHEGSLFLDEIGDMPLEFQPKLLRVLENMEVERIGSTKPRRVDVRVIIATNRNLEKMVEEGLFRQDLYYRLNVAVIRIPPLRERRTDIPDLANHLIDRLQHKRNLEPKTLDRGALELLQGYRWPGNVRQLSNLLEHLMNVLEGPTIRLIDLKRYFESKASKGGGTLTNTLAFAEREAVFQVLSEVKGNKNKAARILGIHRSTLYDKLRKHGLAS